MTMMTSILATHRAALSHNNKTNARSSLPSFLSSSRVHSSARASSSSSSSDDGKKVGIIIVDHGSRAKSSNEQLERFAEMFAMMYGNTGVDDASGYEVEPAHMELASPSIADAFRELIETKNCRKVVVAPFFLSPGRHVKEDIPRLVEDAANEYRGKYELEYMVAAPIALHPLMTTIIHERVEKCLEVNEKGTGGKCDVCVRKDAGISCKMKRV